MLTRKYVLKVARSKMQYGQGEEGAARAYNIATLSRRLHKTKTKPRVYQNIASSRHVVQTQKVLKIG